MINVDEYKHIKNINQILEYPWFEVHIIGHVIEVFPKGGYNNPILIMDLESGSIRILNKDNDLILVNNPTINALTDKVFYEFMAVLRNIGDHYKT